MNLSGFFFKRIIVFLIFSCFIITSAIAQEKNEKVKSEFWKHVRFGGGLGLSFGDGFFSGSIAPSGIYEFDKQFALGLGLNATFNKQKNIYKSTILGGSIIGLYNPIQEIQLSGEFEQLHVNRNFDENYVSNLDSNYWSPALFVGAGYRAQNITIGIRYDLLYKSNKSVYAQAWIPFIRVYF
ncbi:alpha-ketoglutarate decarboxylase [Lacinutrix iliipiscaria]|uniref:Alpha-ketoglutarate decarboxylase n=1 Tax=Lacinutrix iliipiscaria TaxID=1230532 RepID=A0ABW5WHS6_9FLAO